MAISKFPKFCCTVMTPVTVYDLPSEIEFQLINVYLLTFPFQYKKNPHTKNFSSSHLVGRFQQTILKLSNQL